MSSNFGVGSASNIFTSVGVAMASPTIKLKQ